LTEDFILPIIIIILLAGCALYHVGTGSGE